MFSKRGIKFVKYAKFENFSSIYKGFSEIPSQGAFYIKPKFYSDVNLLKEKEYYDFEKMKLQIG
jgi:hypothetical protein